MTTDGIVLAGLALLAVLVSGYFSFRSLDLSKQKEETERGKRFVEMFLLAFSVSGTLMASYKVAQLESVNGFTVVYIAFLWGTLAVIIATHVTFYLVYEVAKILSEKGQGGSKTTT